MQVTYDAAMARVYLDEGGYTNDRLDPGKATNRGITISEANKYAAAFGWITGRAVTDADMRVLPKWFADKVYAEKYAKPIRYDDLVAGFDYSCLDAEINSGIGRVVPWSAKALGKPAKTIADVVTMSSAAPDKVKLIQSFWAVRLSFLKSLSIWSHFGKGWGRRITSGEAAAVKMWLQFGAALSPAAVSAKMQAEATKANVKSKSQAATATATGGTTAAAAPQLDAGHLGAAEWILIGLLAAAGVALIVWLVHRAIVNKQRADAYAAA